MSTIVNLPSQADLAWKESEKSIRLLSEERELPNEVVEDALPRIKQHWLAIFQPIALELPKRPVPGSLTRQQAQAIQAIINAAADVVMKQLSLERDQAFERLVIVELALSRALLAKLGAA